MLGNEGQYAINKASARSLLSKSGIFQRLLGIGEIGLDTSFVIAAAGILAMRNFRQALSRLETR